MPSRSAIVTGTSRGIGAATLALGAPARAQEAAVMTEDEARTTVMLLYGALTATSPELVGPLVTEATTPDWQNCSGEEACETREATIVRWSGRVAVVPDLAWEERDLMVAGDRVIVRGEVSGTPALPFFGVKPSGRGFRLMTIDVHEVRDGRVARTHHAENWASAIEQLTAPR